MSKIACQIIVETNESLLGRVGMKNTRKKKIRSDEINRTRKYCMI